MPGPRGRDPFDEFFRPFFRDLPPHSVHSLGSGFSIDPDGYVVTNNHVVDGATRITVKLSDGREFPAKVVGRDARTDLALLKIEATGLPIVPLGDSAPVQVGQPVMAIGNPFGLEQTVTTGIVSATGRVIGAGPYDQFIQTDASINPGNSGGPLINTQGQAIGINTAILSRDGGSNGVGFAIPISLAKPVVTQLAASGHVVRGWLGVAIQPLTPALAKSLHAPDTNGALVASVVPGSPAMKAGVKPGDVIVEYNARTVGQATGLSSVVGETPVGRVVPITVLRDGSRMQLSAAIAQLADNRSGEGGAAPEKASLGVAVEPLTPEVAQQLGVADTQGLVVRSLDEDSRAAQAGIRPGDVIVEVDHRRVTTVQELTRDLTEHRGDTPILLLVHRDGRGVFVAVS
jgi:serine protease Do